MPSAPVIQEPAAPADDPRPALAPVPLPVNADQDDTPAGIAPSSALWQQVMAEIERERGRTPTLPLPASTRLAPRKAKPRDPAQPALLALPDGERRLFTGAEAGSG